MPGAARFIPVPKTHEMDAAIMDGSTLRTGALSCVHGVKNPIRAARVVMEQSPHVLMTSDGAMAFLREHGVEFMPDAYFDTEHRLAQLHQAQARQPGAAVLDHDGAAAASKLSFAGNPLDEKTKMGTVGAVALDSRGNLAAATSTGGMTNKLPGRVGIRPSSARVAMPMMAWRFPAPVPANISSGWWWGTT